MSWSYWQGRRGEAFTGGDYSEYQRGVREGGGGAGGGLGLIVVFIVLLYIIFMALVIAAWAALCSVLAALLLVLAMRFWQADRVMPFGFAFRTAFYSTLVTVGMSIVMALGLGVLLDQGIGAGLLQGLATQWGEAVNAAMLRVQQQAPRSMNSFLLFSVFMEVMFAHPKVLLSFIVFSWGPGFLISGAIFSRRIGAPFNGMRGYLKAVITAGLCLAPSLLLTNLLVLKLGSHVRDVLPGMDTLRLAGILAAFTVIGYALLGGLVMAMLLHVVLRLVHKGDAPSFGRNYGTAFLGGLVYSITTIAALFLFPQGDRLLAWIYTRVVAEAPFAAVAGSDGLLPALMGFLPLQLPGVLLFAGIATARAPRQFSGYLGYVRAAVLCGAIALLIFLPFVALAAGGVAGR